MPIVRFESDEDDELVVEVGAAAWLMDVCDQYGAPVPFSCRNASCGTCCVQVLQGHEWLEPADGDERVLIDDVGAQAGQRFACAVRVRPGVGVLVIRACGDFER